MTEQSTLPNAENCSLDEIVAAMKCARTMREFVRIQTIRYLILGYSLNEVSMLVLKQRRTINEWIRRFNESGIDGLLDQPRPGRPRKITSSQCEQYKDLIENPDKAQQEHWTAKKFHG